MWQGLFKKVGFGNLWFKRAGELDLVICGLGELESWRAYILGKIITRI